MKLQIAIPALNEEESIEGIIRRTLDARAAIIEGSPVTAVEVTVVSDGSTDRTVEIAERFTDQIRLIKFPQNRGYGRAILEAWAGSDAELLAFLDADGTCDPTFFATLCTAIEADPADVALGCRLHGKSKMPRIRRFGNLLFSTLLSTVSGKTVRDTASGMRVVRRSKLEKLMPLPGGLHFTPAMSARAVLRGDVTISEIDMPYHEREGRSKLQVVRDGFRFLGIILDALFLYRPDRPLVVVGGVAMVGAAVLMASPSLHYLQTGMVQEWMIYRFIVAHLLGTSGLLTVCAAYLSRKIVALTVLPEEGTKPFGGWLHRAFQSPAFWLLPLLLLVAGGGLVVTSLVDRVTTGVTAEHWSRFIAMSFFASLAFILVVTRVMDHSLGLMASWLAYHRPGVGPSVPNHDG